MPWTVDDVDRFKHGLSDAEKRQWVAVANSVLARCLERGGERSECEASAIRQASGVAGSRAFDHYHVLASNYTVREELHQGRKHLVVPVVMMVEGVHSGSHGPLLHLADELGRFVGAWNGIPVSVQHPEEDGVNVSANQPGVIDTQVVGRVYNTAMEGGRLKAEAWLDEGMLSAISPETLEAVMAGRPLDVSVGVFTEDDYVSGEWDGERYEAVARHHRPDHLALLPGGTGACSWADGCGVRTHGEGGNDVKTNSLRYSGTESAAWSAPSLSDFGVEDAQWADLSQADRAKVASHYLVGSSGAESFGDLKFPVVNPGTGKLNERALRAVISGRGAQASIPAEQRIRARRTAYRLLNDEFGAELEVPESLSRKEMAADGLNVNEMGYRERADKIQRKLDRMDDDAKVHYLEEVYDDNFIYRVEQRGGESGLFKRSYVANADDTVDFTGESVAVTKRVEYVTMEKEGEVMANTEKKPCCPEKVELLIQDEHTKFDEGDREWLLTLGEGQLAKLEQEPPAPAPASEPDEAVREEIMRMSQEQAIRVLQERFGDPEKAMALFPKEIQEQLSFGLKAYKAERARLISHITENAPDVYTAEELEARSMDELEKLAKLVKPKVDYSPMGPTPQPSAYAEEGLYPIGVTD